MKFPVHLIVVALMFLLIVFVADGALVQEGYSVDVEDNVTIQDAPLDLSEDPIERESFAISSNGTVYTEGEDYEVNYVEGTLDFVTCSEQGSPSSSKCPTSGEEATVSYNYLTERNEPSGWAVPLGEIAGPLAYLFGVVFVVIALASVVKRL